MISVSYIVNDLLQEDEEARNMFSQGLLNVTAYAAKIQKDVERRCMKPVRKGTIAVALSRLSKAVSKLPPLKYPLELEGVSVKSSLCALTYEKTGDIQRRLATLHPFLVAAPDLFTVTEGVSEVTLMCTEKSKAVIEEHMGDIGKELVKDLVAITVQFPQEYANQPNLLYTLLASIAPKHINIIEIVSTFSEVSIVVDKKDMEEVVKRLNTYTK